MPKVRLRARAGMRYEGIRYREGDQFVVSEWFLSQHPTRLEVIKEPAKKRKRKQAEPAPTPAPIIEAQDEAPAAEVIRSDADHTGDSGGL